MLIYPVWFERHIPCPNCHTEDSLELYDKFNKGVGYLTYLKYGGYEDLMNKRELRYFRCNHCRKEFPIDFSGEYPIPMSMETYKDFEKRFRSTD